MVKIIFDPYFKNSFFRLKDKQLKEKIIKQIEKININPLIGKPMRYNRKNTRELYISPFRLSYEIEGDLVLILALYHKDEQ